MNKYSHVETNHFRLTFTDNPEGFKNEEQDKCLKVTVNDPEIGECEFKLFGFALVKDAAGDEVIYYKIKEEERLVLYKLTGHPDAGKLLAVLEMGAQIYGFEIRSIDTDIAEAIDAAKRKAKGTLDDKPGIHPRMEKYFKGELK